MEEMWLARDSDNFLYLYVGIKPEKNDFIWNSLSADVIRLDSDLFPDNHFYLLLFSLFQEILFHHPL